MDYKWNIKNKKISTQNLENNQSVLNKGHRFSLFFQTHYEAEG